MENIIYKLINEFTEGVDTYTHNDSTWLIFTESKQWVIELTKEKTLWYNYNFFKEVFEYTSMNVIKHQQYITKWVEDNIIDKVNNIRVDVFNTSQSLCEDILVYGVKKTNICNYVNPDDGIMWIKWGYHIDDVIENGVRETMFNQGHRQPVVKNIIENGILRTKTPGEDGDLVGYLEWVDGKTIRKFPEMINDIIENGINETKSWNESIIGDLNQNGCIDNVIKEGVKETKGDASQNPMGKVTKVIKEGIKNPTY